MTFGQKKRCYGELSGYLRWKIYVQCILIEQQYIYCTSPHCFTVSFLKVIDLVILNAIKFSALRNPQIDNINRLMECTLKETLHTCLSSHRPWYTTLFTKEYRNRAKQLLFVLLALAAESSIVSVHFPKLGCTRTSIELGHY